LLKIADQRLRQICKIFFCSGAVVGFSILWPFLIQFRLAPMKIHLDKASDALRDALQRFLPVQIGPTMC